LSKAGEVRRLRAAACLSICMVWVTFMQGCSTSGSRDLQLEQRVVQERLEQSLIAAEKAQKQGQMEQALQLLDDASRIDPAAKQPWLKRAQIHFEARQYGPAITQAHEALQRDVGDVTAQSILAVSGLRVSAAALEQLRKANEFTGSTRSEAEHVARVIHQALGEPILMAPAAAGLSTPPAAASRRGTRGALRSAAPAGNRPTTAVGQGAAQATAQKPVPDARTAPAPTSRGNPFGALQ
jgi:Tfp pilus assembly protein PilF